MRALPVQVLISTAALALAAPAARAADPPPIRVSVPACPSAPFSVEAFLGSLEVELAGHLPACCVLAPAPAAEAPGLLVTLSIEPCDASAGAVDVRVRDPARPAGAERKVGLGDIPLEARPRALALAVAELVHSVSQPPPPAPTPPSPLDSPVRAQHGLDAGGAPPPRIPWIFLSAMVQIETHPGHNMTVWGIRPSVAVARGRWQAAFDLEAMSGDPSVPLGDVSTTVLAGALAVGPRLVLRHSIVDLAACGTLGWARMAGKTNDPSAVAASGAALIGSVGGRLGIFVPTSARVSHLRALVEAGAMVHGLDATINGNTAAGLAGGYLLFGLGFGENR